MRAIASAGQEGAVNGQIAFDADGARLIADIAHQPVAALGVQPVGIGENLVQQRLQPGQPFGRADLRSGGGTWPSVTARCGAWPVRLSPGSLTMKG